MTDTADAIDVREVPPPTPQPEPQAEPAPEPEQQREHGTALLAAEPDAVAAYLPVPAEWQIILQQADVLAASDLVPTAYRRKPANVVLATLAGRPFGWDASMAMRSFHIIEGMPTMKPEIMLALIRKAGHSVDGDSAWDHATVTGRRRDTGETMTTGFTVHDAVRAGLCTLDEHGQPFARSDRGKPLPWEQYPESMCWARAISKLARMLFSDVVLGAGYVPEEFGTYVSDDGAVIDVGEVQVPTWAQPDSPPTPMDKAVAAALRWRAKRLPEAAAGLLKKQLYERDLQGGFATLPASKEALVRGLVEAMEKRAAAGEWGDWQYQDPPEPTRPPTDDDLATDYNTPPSADRQADIDRNLDEMADRGDAAMASVEEPSPPEPPAEPAVTAPVQADSVEEQPEASAAEETPEQAMLRAAEDAAALIAMAKASGEPFEGAEPTAQQPATAAEVPQVDLPVLAAADIAKMGKAAAVEALAARGLDTGGNLNHVRDRLAQFEATRAPADS